MPESLPLEVGATVGASDACGASVPGAGASVSAVGVGAVITSTGAGVATSARYLPSRQKLSRTTLRAVQAKLNQQLT